MLRSIAKLGKGTAGGQVSVSASLPAPVGGWNVRDPLANMEETDAVTLDNIFPQPAAVMVRMGYTKYATGLSTATGGAGAVESLLPWNGPSSSKLYAAADSMFIDITAGGTATATAVKGLSNARWQSVNFTTSGGVYFLYAVNGTDHPWLWNGSAWTTGSAVGVTANNFIHVNVFKQRLWAVEKDTLKAWYFNTGAVLGTVNAVDLSGFVKNGGYLQAMGTWTIDAGAGVDDYAVFVTSEGEVVVFEGSDPTSSSTWAMKGRWELGAPLGRRCLIRFGGDLLIACLDGVLPLSRALISSRVNPRVALTDKIQGAMTESAGLYKDNFGWDMLFYPKGSMVLLNVPVQAGTDQEQYAMNTITKAWGRFQNVDANCWVLYNDEPYFGSANYVGRFWNTLADAGAVINWEGQQAFSYFKSRGQLKHFKEARPIFQSNGTPSTAIGLNVDYDTTDPTGTLSFAAVSYGIWDTATWDSGVWGGDLSVIAGWQGISGVGVCASMHMTGQSSGIEVQWMATDFIYEPGGMGVG